MTIGSFFLLIVVIFLAGVAFYYYFQVKERAKTKTVSPYTEGLLAVLQGDRLRAIQKLRETVASDSTNIDAYLRLGSLFAEMGDLSRAIKVHRTLTLRADLKTSQKIEVYRALAKEYTLTSDSARTLESLQQILSMSKKDLWALEQKCILQEAQEDWAGAYDSAVKLLNAGGTVSQRRLAVLKLHEGSALCRNKKERDGRIQFREAMKLDNTFVGPYLYWGDSYIRENRTEDAVKIWKRLLDVNPAQSYLAFERLEQHLFDLGRFSEVEQIYRTVIRTYPQNIHAYVALAKFLDKRGDRGDALSVLEDGVSHNPNSLWLRRRLIQMYGEMCDFDRVLALSRDVLSRVMKEGYEFSCSNCNHVSREPLWLCPKCNKLDSFNV
jgi:lipopolysaccharide assembly protein B